MALITALSGIIPHSLPNASTLLFLLIIALPAYHFVILPIYYTTKSQLSNLPGPTLTLLTPYYITLLDAFHLRTTTLHKWHLKYGPVVRVGPNEVSFTSPTAIKQIYQDPTMEKDSRLYGRFKHFGADNAFTSRTRNEHGWRRKGIAALLSWSTVLESERVDMWIGTVVGRYLRMIEEHRLASYLVHDGNVRKYLVDVYLLNNWFATDVVTGFSFGCKRGTKTLLPETHSHSKGEEKWWQRPSYHRRMVKEHYASTFRAHTYLYVEFPRLMRLIEKIINIGGAVVKKLSTMAGGNSDVAKWDSEVIGSRIDDWGWKTWIDIKADPRRGRTNGTCVAAALARLVDGTGDLSVGGEIDNDGHRKGTWTDESAASELMDIMLAGMDTTSDTLSFLLYHLSLPASGLIQSKLHNELITAFPPLASGAQLPPFLANSSHWSSSEVPLDYSKFLQTISALPYLNAVLKETLRLYSAIPGTLPRIVPEVGGRGKIIDGLYMSPGTVIGSFAYGIHRDPSVVESDRFEPQKWIIPGSPQVDDRLRYGDDKHWDEEQDKHTAVTDGNTPAGVHDKSLQDDEIMRVRAMEKRLWAFGSGGRGCVGRHLATLEMKILIATIFWNYKTEIVDDKEAQIIGKLDHSHWDHRKTFRDVLPFKDVNGVLAFTPYTYSTLEGSNTDTDQCGNT